MKGRRVTLLQIICLSTIAFDHKRRVNCADVAKLLVRPGAVGRRFTFSRFSLRALFRGFGRFFKGRGKACEFQSSDGRLTFSLPGKPFAGNILFESGRRNMRACGDVNTVRKDLCILCIDREDTTFGEFADYERISHLEFCVLIDLNKTLATLFAGHLSKTQGTPNRRTFDFNGLCARSNRLDHKSSTL